MPLGINHYARHDVFLACRWHFVAVALIAAVLVIVQRKTILGNAAAVGETARRRSSPASMPSR